jgi:uncharacterized protein
MEWEPVFIDPSLPIFTRRMHERSLFYTPGWMVSVPLALSVPFRSAIQSCHQGIWLQADDLRIRAYRARHGWRNLLSKRFTPTCLTIYLNNTCNLSCTYCFSDPGRLAAIHLSLETIQSAACMVAKNCQSRQLPLTVVFHGGGEPTLDHDLIFRALDLLEELADRFHIGIFRYLATNGIMSSSLACQLAARFDLIGLSCDGPPDIQNHQRPLPGRGKSTSSMFVEQSARLVHSAGKPLHVRVTVTPESMDRQVEIADYICRNLAPETIHVEPVYAGGRSSLDQGFEMGQAKDYIKAFTDARKIAWQHGVSWTASGSRPSELHGAYCNVWRDVLNLTPEGLVTACFARSQASELKESGMGVGGWEPLSGEFILDEPGVVGIRTALSKEPPECISCFNRYHCVRNCPDTCILDEGNAAGGFRCQIQALMTDAVILECAERLTGDGSNDDKIVAGPVGWDIRD